MTLPISVAIPVLNAGPALAATLAAVAAQRVDREVEVVVCDSGSSDGSVSLARESGATVFEIAPADFSHGRTRNLLMSRCRGEYVAFLTQDSVPADERWLHRLLGGLSLAADVAIAFGPYRPRPGASPMVARELTAWFASFAPDGAPVIDRLTSGEGSAQPRWLLGRRGFFTDANGVVSRAAWERVRFRDVPYAEDHILAHDMLRAGYAKVFVPDAAVVHSHEYSLTDRLRRSFDEARALREIYGWVEPASPRLVARNLWGSVGADRRWQLADGRRLHDRSCQLKLLADSSAYHVARTAGATLGGRAERLPRGLRARLSLEGRPG
ncbi:MAG: glycosyltransferase [Solirubrobacteraceae bacterium]